MSTDLGSFHFADAVALAEGEGAVHRTAMAATIRGVAVNELLLAWRYKVVCDQD